jgi:hypothetical protein
MYSPGASRQFSNFSHPAGGGRAFAVEKQIAMAAKKPRSLAEEGMKFFLKAKSPLPRDSRGFLGRVGMLSADISNNNVTKL